LRSSEQIGPLRCDSASSIDNIVRLSKFQNGGLCAMVIASWLLTTSSPMAAEPQAAAQNATPVPSGRTAAQEAYFSILTEGSHTTPADASRLESGLAGDPHNVAARTRLISYYYQNMIAEPRTRHILWLIENHPEAQIFQFASDVTVMAPNWTNLNSDAHWDRARALWLRQIERFPNSVLVLSNAAQALPIEDSIGLMRRLRALEPEKFDWTVNLAMMYAQAVRNVFFVRNPGDGRRAFAFSKKYRETPMMRLPGATAAAAERMKNELETSTDASLIGVTGELLVEQVGLLSQHDAESPEMVNSADFGRRLLERARSLEPDNPRWRQ
jgi:hypothetical protein